MTDDSTAEKAWEEYFEVEQHKTLYLPGSLCEAFMAGRASKPDVTALLRERAELRKQLAEARQVQHCWKDGKTFCGESAEMFRPATTEESSARPMCTLCHKRAMHFRADLLAEAQATIAAIEERALRERERGGSNASMARIVLSILSAPSSTGGESDAE